MRRKSERNKSKSSPEKKLEKPTRKSTRRRARKSPSSSPERENSNDADVIQEDDKEAVSNTPQPRITEETETIIEEPETKVSSTETITKPQEVEDAGSVWKAARADASPGEIPKLKLSRQRNLSETSDVSLNRKRTSKWQEGGEGIAEEADSADEKPATSLSTDAGDEPADNPSSTIPGRDSGEEVSDSKEFPPENASADLSDDKPNIDQQDDTIETPNCTTSIVDNRPTVPEQPIDSADPKVDDTNDDANEANDEAVNGQTKEKENDDGESTAETTTAVVVKTPEHTSTINQEDDNNKSEQAPIVNKDPSSSEDERDNHKDDVRESASSDNSHDESNEKKVTQETRVTVRTARRKHRDKYQDSSNSDSADSDDEPTRIKKKTTEPEINVTKSPINTQEVPDRSSEPEIILSQQTDSIVEMDCEEPQNNREKSPVLPEKIDRPTSSDKIQPAKPTKVNLKRSFSTRLTNNSTEKRIKASDNNDDQGKENVADTEQPNPATMPKKRRWGTALSTDTTPAYSISTDSLKALVPNAKPLSINEVRLSKDDEDEKERRRDREKRYSSDVVEEKGKEDGDVRTESAKGDNYMAARRKISIVKDVPLKSPSPTLVQPTNILLIKNLVRPFTLNQIKELLSRTGTIVENGFWMDRIKSKCFVEYSNEDQAFETRQALHGISWPLSNPKKLQVEYATKEDMDQARESSKDQVSLRKTETIASADMWQQDWIRDEKPNSHTKVTVVREWDLGKEDGHHLMREKERDKKEIEKKRRQRSRTPIVDQHLPAPARKFKKKEDEPPPAKLLDDLFRKTKATPCIYWLPLTNEQIVVKEEMRRQHMAEHARQLEEMRRAERNRDNRRRRSPRK